MSRSRLPKSNKVMQKRKKRILILTQVYPPEIQATAVMVRELSEYLASREWDVTVCAGLPHHPHGKLYPGYEWKLMSFSRENGYVVKRTGHLVHPSRSILARGAVYVTQALGTALLGMLNDKVDVVLVYGPPLAGPNLAALVAARHRAKLITVIYDIYPDIAVETGKVKNPLVIGLAKIAEKTQYWSADKILVLSEGFKKTLVAKGVPAEKIVVIPVWLDPNEIKPMDRDNPWRREQGIPLDKFVVLYAGTIGVISNARMVADAARLLKDREDILFLFVGDGEEKPIVEARVKEYQLRNVRFLPYQPRERLAEVQATADVGLVTLAPGRGRTSVPSKVLGYMAAARPIIACVDPDSDTASDVNSARIGFVVHHEESLAATIVSYVDKPDDRLAAGERARKHFELEYSKTALLPRYELILTSLAR